MGRATYQMMEAYWPRAGEHPNASYHYIEHWKWYNDVLKVVFSWSLHEQSLPNTTIIGKNLEQEVLELKRLPGKDIIMFGSPTAAHHLMKHDLIDEYGLFVNPVLLGHGIPMFHDIDRILNLKPSPTRTFSSGVICLRYQRNRS